MDDDTLTVITAPDHIKKMAWECYKKLCPYAPKLDINGKPWPAEKSTTQKAFIIGYHEAMRRAEIDNSS